MKQEVLAQSIIDGIGGKENIIQAWHCITRLRFNVKDSSQINAQAIKDLEGVIGTQVSSGQFQVIIGSEVANVYQEISKIIGETNNAGIESPNEGKKGNILDQLFDVISGIFTPILAAITGSGLLKGLIAILVSFHFMSATSDTYLILNAISDATFHFLPFLIAFSAANKFKTNPSLAAALAGVLMYPQLMELAAGGEVTSIQLFNFLTVPINNYSSSVLPIILGVWLMSYIEKYVKKFTPNSLSIIFVPLLTLLLTAPVLLAFIAPLGTLLGSYLEIFFTALFRVAGPFAGLLMGGLMPLIVVTGMHYAFFPSTFESIKKLGYDILLLPLNLVANLAQAGATLGVMIKSKDSKMKQLAFSAFIPALFGITEPAIYGVTMKLKKPFYASMAGGAIGGVIYGSFMVRTDSFVIPGLLALPGYISQGQQNFYLAVVGIVVSFTVALLLTLFLPFDTTGNPKEEKKEKGESTSNEATQPLSIVAPLSGSVLELKDFPDQTFASGMMGKGMGVLPVGDTVYAPFNGTVSMVTPTKHAIGLTSTEGVELLIHVGLETVSLNGQGFEYVVKEGDVVSLGAPLLKFNRQVIEEAELQLCTAIVVTNTADFLDVIPIVKYGAQVQSGKENVLLVIQ